MSSVPATMLAYRMLAWQQPPQLLEIAVPTAGPTP